MKIKIVSFDIFQTLVDVNKRIPQIWKGILGDEYTDEKGFIGSNSIISNYPAALESALLSGRFCNMRDVYLECAKSVTEQTGYDVSIQSIVDNLLFQHSQAPFYDDVFPCFHSLLGNYKIILSSDSNHTMVDTLIKNIPACEIFISDDLSAYKSGFDGAFFKTVLNKMNADPDEILHIGDSSADIIGARNAGIRSCWLNRENRTWNHTFKPDYTITSLSEINDILENT